MDFSLATEGVCRPTESADLKKKGFAIAQKLVDTRVKGSSWRQAEISVLVICDPARAGKVLSALAKDKDKSIVAEAKKRLAELSKK